MTGSVIVEADGGSRGNPGPAGFGALVRDAATGEVLARRSAGLGSVTNNVAEYAGLIAGLEAAVEIGATEVEVRMDSKLVIEQMSGRWRVKHANLRPLALKAGQLVQSLGMVRFEWVPRARNKSADQLANEAMDEQAGMGAANVGGQPESSEGGTASAATPALSENSTAEDSSNASPSEVSRTLTSAENPTTSTATAAGGWTGATGAPTTVLLLRHGQTVLSIDRRYSGRHDVPLTEVGEQQAHAAAKRIAAMDVVAGEAVPVFTSPLTRAKQTAEAVADAIGGPLITHEGLVETDFGDWEGLTFLEAAERYSELHRRWLGDATVEPPNGESLASVFERTRAFQHELVQRHEGKTIVVVTHVTPIKSLLRLALDVGPSVFYRLHLDLASLSLAEFYPDGNASVRLVNDTSYLG